LRKSLWIAIQVILALAVGYAVLGALGRSWDQLTDRGIHLTLRAAPVLAAGGVVLATYGLLIEGWRRVLGGWDQRLSFPVATRIWALSNLGRYLPGKIWAVAGMAALAQRAGVAPWAATASAIILQALAVGTAAALVAATAPAAAPGTGLLVAFACAAAAVAAVSWPPAARRLLALGTRLGVGDVPPLRPGAVAIGTATTLAGWVAYGVSLKLWAAGTLTGAGAGLTLPTAVGAFTASYVIGLLALFAPGGLFVREGVMFALLEGPLGPADALAVAVGSRLLLTITEIVAALIGIAWPAGRIDVARSD